jgi:hypothetical protein
MLAAQCSARAAATARPHVTMLLQAGAACFTPAQASLRNEAVALATRSRALPERYPRSIRQMAPQFVAAIARDP